MADFIFPNDGDDDSAANFGAWLARSAISQYVETGMSFTPDYVNNTLDITAGRAYLLYNNEDKVIESDARTGLSLPATNGTNYVFLTPSWTINDSVSFTINTTNSAPSGPYLKIGEVDTASNTYTEQNRKPNFDIDDFVANTGEFETSLTMQDSAELYLGTGGDFYWRYDPVNDYITLLNRSGAFQARYRQNGVHEVWNGFTVHGALTGDAATFDSLNINGGTGSGTVHIIGDNAVDGRTLIVDSDGESGQDDDALLVRGNTSPTSATDADTVLGVKGDGRVGINTYSPSGALDVVGGEIYFNNNEVNGFRLENRTTDPTSVPVGTMWYRSDKD